MRDYLEKLINLEITVPQRSDLPPQDLLDTSAPSDHSALLRQALALWPLLVGAAAVVIGLGLGKMVVVGKDVAGGGAQSVAAAAKSQRVGLAAESETEGTGPSLAEGSAPLDDAKGPPPNATPTVQPGKVNLTGIDSRSARWMIAAIFAAFAAAASGVLIYRVRNTQRHVEDTQEFADALRTWLPLVARRRATPRLIKRFGNRLRYLSMLQQAETLDLSLLDELQQRWQGLTRRGRARLAQARRAMGRRHTALAEHRLVALGALQSVFGPAWRAQIALATAAEADATDAEPRGDDDMRQVVARAIADYTRATGATWPPTIQELALFERTLQGVRLSGAV